MELRAVDILETKKTKRTVLQHYHSCIHNIFKNHCNFGTSTDYVGWELLKDANMS